MRHHNRIHSEPEVCRQRLPATCAIHPLHSLLCYHRMPIAAYRFQNSTSVSSVVISQSESSRALIYCNTLQDMRACRSLVTTLQHIVIYCNTLQDMRACRSLVATLQHIVMYCNTLQDMRAFRSLVTTVRFREFLPRTTLLHICDIARGGGLGSRPQKMYGERLGDGVEYHLMSPTPRH